MKKGEDSSGKSDSGSWFDFQSSHSSRKPAAKKPEAMRIPAFKAEPIERDDEGGIEVDEHLDKTPTMKMKIIRFFTGEKE